MCNPVKAIHLKSGEMLYHQGDDNQSVYIVASGELVMFVTEDGERRDCEKRGSGTILGGLSVLTGQLRVASAQALTDVVAYRVSADHIMAGFDKIDPLLRACVSSSITFNARLQNARRGLAKGVPDADAGIANPEALIEQYRLEIDLLSAITNNDLSMAYQPIVTLGEGRVVGFEALMRWTDADRGYVPPDQFIPVAERLGVIGKLTEFALSQSCQTLNHLQDTLQTPYPLFASVNISAHDIARPGFAEQLSYILDAHSISPEQIKLEVTETAIVPSNLTAVENLKAIKVLGCGLSIDDFGTGYSNLAHLKALPLNTLKIDRAFAGDAHCNDVSGSIVSMLVGLGASLNLDIVAEGVETESDVKALSDLGCLYGQGYFFHRPAAEDELISILTEQNHAPKTPSNQPAA